jgi:hypothetical protein
MSQGRVPDLTDPNASFQGLWQLRMVEMWTMVLLNGEDTQYYREQGFHFSMLISMGSLRLTMSIL